MAVEFQSVITMANSIIGVSVLAMPYCFKQCGIILATLMLLMSGFVVKMACHLLVKSAISTRRRNYEILAFQTYGAPGKMAVEISMIGFMFGTCIAFFVVIGDLAPPIIANIFDVTPSDNFKMYIQFGICIFLVLPLTMLRNLDSLFPVSTASVLFYCCVMLHIIFAARQNIFNGSWTDDVIWWRPAGIFQCLPIFCMALSCQCQVFEIYESLPDPSLSKMNEVVKGAVNICSGVYIAVGLFGYIACSEVDFGGNILTSFPPSTMLEIVKLGFVLSVAVSFPLVIFPCRTSIHSLIYRKGNAPTDMISNFIPPVRFNVITVSVVFSTLVMGILLPDIEFVLGIVGSTIGNVICIIFPAVIFIKITSRNTTERLAAQAIFILGVILMILGTYVNLYEADMKTATKPKIEIEEKPLLLVAPAPGNLELEPGDALNEIRAPVVEGEPAFEKKTEDDHDSEKIKTKKLNSPEEPKRQEPIEPVPPLDEKENDDGGQKDKEKSLKKYDTVGVKEEKKKKKEEKEEVVEVLHKDTIEQIHEDVEDLKKKEEEQREKEEELKVKEAKAEKLIEELEKQKNEHKQIILEQKQVLEELKQHVDEDKKARASSNQQQPPLADQNQPQQPLIVQNQAQQVIGHQQPVVLQNQAQPVLQKQVIEPPAQPLGVQNQPVSEFQLQQDVGQPQHLIGQNQAQHVLPQQPQGVKSQAQPVYQQQSMVNQNQPQVIGQQQQQALVNQNLAQPVLKKQVIEPPQQPSGVQSQAQPAFQQQPLVVQNQAQQVAGKQQQLLIDPNQSHAEVQSHHKNAGQNQNFVQPQLPVQQQEQNFKNNNMQPQAGNPNVYQPAVQNQYQNVPQNQNMPIQGQPQNQVRPQGLIQNPNYAHQVQDLPQAQNQGLPQAPLGQQQVASQSPKQVQPSNPNPAQNNVHPPENPLFINQSQNQASIPNVASVKQTPQNLLEVSQSQNDKVGHPHEDEGKGNQGNGDSAQNEMKQGHDNKEMKRDIVLPEEMWPNSRDLKFFESQNFPKPVKPSDCIDCGIQSQVMR